MAAEVGGARRARQVVLGIDLGKTTCSAAIFRDGEVELIPQDGSKPCMDAVVAFGGSQWLVGEIARRAGNLGVAEAVSDFVLLLGRKMSDFSADQLRQWPFRLVQGVAGKAMVELTSRSLQRTVFAPEELVAVLFAAIRQLAEVHCQVVITETVVTVPASFNRTQRLAIRHACAMAGLDAHRMVVTSTASTIAYAHATRREQTDNEATLRQQMVMAIDIGAGSVNISMVSINTSQQRIEVKAVAGDSSLGGDVFTQRIVHFFQNQVSTENATDEAMASDTGVVRLRRACELAMKMLDASDRASIHVSLGDGSFSRSITRTEFDAACVDCWDRLVSLVHVVLTESHVTIREVHQVLLCGGCAAVPAISNAVKSVFVDLQPIICTERGLQAQGAAILAASHGRVLESNPLRVQDVVPLALGVQRIGVKDTTVIVHANTAIPTKQLSVLFAAARSELTYRVVEGRNLLQHSPSHADKDEPRTGVHCIGFIRLGIHPSAASRLVVKLEITFDVDDDNHLVATAVDMSSGRCQTLELLGDETALSLDAVERWRHELGRLFGAHRAVLPTLGRSTNLECIDEDDLPMKPDEPKHPLTRLTEYAAGLMTMITANRLEIAVSTDDKRDLTTKIESILEWLHTLPTNSIAASTATANGRIASDSNTDLETAIATRMQSLRRLHLSVAAATAIAELRRADSD